MSLTNNAAVLLPTALRTITELGQEKRCMCCGEFWPADSEFFQHMRSSRDGLTPRCIACIKAGVWQLLPRAIFRSDEISAV